MEVMNIIDRQMNITQPVTPVPVEKLRSSHPVKPEPASIAIRAKFTKCASKLAHGAILLFILTNHVYCRKKQDTPARHLVQINFIVEINNIIQRCPPKRRDYCSADS